MKIILKTKVLNAELYHRCFNFTILSLPQMLIFSHCGLQVSNLSFGIHFRYFDLLPTPARL